MCLLFKAGTYKGCSMLYKDILMIDDDPEDAEIFIDAVISLGKNIKCRYNRDSVKALEELRLSDKLPDLLFIDVNMPRLNGFDLVQQLQNDARLKQIEVILMSSCSEETIRMVSPERIFGKYMAKAYTFNQFVDELNKIL